ncbi:MAG: pilus (MSHA type) biogenesis protein MshL [Thermodesulfobacteriota bacterium]
MKNGIRISVLVLMVLFLAGCAGQGQKEAADPAPVSTEPRTVQIEAPAPPKEETGKGPGWMVDNKGFRTRPLEMDVREGLPYTPVGAEIVSKGAPVRLIDVIQRMADLQGLSVSWADDVDPDIMVNVHIRPEDNFWDALQNLLRQRDYFFELNDETIIISYKVTQRYQVVMPTLQEDFETSVGGSLIGGGAVQGRITGKTAITADIREPMDFWAALEDNLNRILESTAAEDKGHFIMDDHIGLITVTAPRKTHEKVRVYLEDLKKQIYRQVVIEARIMEVRLNDEHRMGINWSNILSSAHRDGEETFSGEATFGEDYMLESGDIIANTVYPTHKFLKYMTMSPQAFSIAVDALKEYGTTNVLSNPKITIMNGHGASIIVGEDITYIDKVTTTSDDAGNLSYTVTTASVLSGLGLAVMANIVDDHEVVLYIVPVTSELQRFSASEDIEYRTFGGSGREGAEVGLPRVRLREMSTMARIKDGETLVIGGHIDKTEGDSTNAVPFLGDIPGLGWLFKQEVKSTTTRELVIFITPRLIAASE